MNGPPPSGGFGVSPGPAHLGHVGGQPRQRMLVALFFGLVIAAGGVNFFYYLIHRSGSGTGTAEHRSSLREISTAVSRAHAASHRLCPSAHAVPASVAQVRGKKYQSTKVDWQDDPGWACLGFELTSPQYFQYEYRVTGERTFVITARGDLDGDGKPTTYTLAGRIAEDHVVLGPIEDDEGWL